MEDFTREISNSREEWLSKRGKGIGGSDASCIVNVNPYKSVTKLWEEKIGLKKPVDISDKPEVEYGKKAEKHIIELFKLNYPEYEVKSNTNETQTEILISNKYPYMRASLDSELIEKATGRKGILEIKTTAINSSIQGEKWGDEIPNNYYCQILHYFIVTNYDFAIVCVEKKYEREGGKKYVRETYLIEREEVKDDIDFLQNEEIKFWEENVEKKIRPNIKIEL